jgi:DNA-binding transcriptional regulator PaaX
MILKENRQETGITFKILKTIALAGAITAVAMAPGLAVAFGPFVRDKGTKSQKIIRNRINVTLWRLKKRGMITEDSRGKLALTRKGRALLVKSETKEKMTKKPRHWDRKWRIIAFDIWENRRSTRNLLRRTLQSLGFVKLQASLWVYPYDCEDVIGLLRTDLKISPAIQYMIVEKMDRDIWLRKHFGLP